MADSSSKLKVVVRHLPPDLPEPVFKRTLQPWLAHVDYFQYTPGKQSKRKTKLPTLSHCFLHFSSEPPLLHFAKMYDGWKFANQRGDVHFAVVEYAPSQALPKEDKLIESSAETLFEDEGYLAFLEQLKRGDQDEKTEDVHASASLGEESALLKYLREKKSATIKRDVTDKGQGEGVSGKKKRQRKKKAKQPLQEKEKSERPDRPAKGKGKQKEGAKATTVPTSILSPAVKPVTTGTPLNANVPEFQPLSMDNFERVLHQVSESILANPPVATNPSSAGSKKKKDWQSARGRGRGRGRGAGYRGRGLGTQQRA